MISIVIPVYNSEKIMPKLCKSIDEEMKSHALVYELILVNDCSRDNSASVIKSLSKKYLEVKGVLLERNVGQQNALLAGIRLARYDIVVTMDDDLQHDPKEITRLLSYLNGKTDVVYGVPFNNNINGYRNIGTHVKELCFLLLLKKPRGIRLTSFRVMKKEVVKWIISDPLPHVYISARTLQYTKNIKNVPINYRERDQGQSNYTFKSLFQKLFRVVLNYKILYFWFKNRPCQHQYTIKEIV